MSDTARTFVRRKLEAEFVLGEGTFGESGQDTIKLGSLRMTARIQRAGGNAMGTLDLTIWGMSLSVMNKLSTLGLVPLTARRNTVTLKAFDEDTPPGVVFQGQIINAWVDAQPVPDVPLRVSAATGLLEALRPVDPISFTGDADVANMLSSLATQMGLHFENNGVSRSLSNSYYYGSPRVMAQRIVNDADIEWNGGEDGTLAIWERGGSRGSEAIVISPSNGMIGYPAFSPTGIIVRTLYNPSLSMGSTIEVRSSFQSVLERANRSNRQNVAKEDLSKWVIVTIDHDLEAEMPEGQWFSTINAAPLGYGPVPRK